MDSQSGFQNGLEGGNGLGGEGPETAHAGIDFEMNERTLGCGLSKKNSFLGGGDRGDKATPPYFAVFRWKSGTEKEDRNPFLDFP